MRSLRIYKCGTSDLVTTISKIFSVCREAYLKGTLNQSIVYSAVSHFELQGFADSDWASSNDDRRSTTGYVFSFGSGLVSWASRKQAVVALSSCEAEYVALSQAAQEAVFLRGLASDLGHASGSATIIKGDNQGSLALASNPILHQRSKHIDTRHHFIRDLVNSNVLSLIYIPSGDNQADPLTKNLPKPAFAALVKKLFGLM